MGDEDFTFIKGVNHMSGEEALAFARERHAYSTGDRHRGENQEQVISKIIEKMAFINTFSSFGENLFSLPDIFYFVSITAAFIFLCVRALEKRRWA